MSVMQKLFGGSPLWNALHTPLATGEEQEKLKKDKKNRMKNSFVRTPPDTTLPTQAPTGPVDETTSGYSPTRIVADKQKVMKSVGSDRAKNVRSLPNTPNYGSVDLNKGPSDLMTAAPDIASTRASQGYSYADVGKSALGGGKVADRARRARAGDTIMAPAPTSEASGPPLITKEQAKKMGIGVNQWRELNKEILGAHGDLMRQQEANIGIAEAAKIRGQTDIAMQRQEANDPAKRLEALILREDLDLAPLRKKLKELQLESFTTPVAEESGVDLEDLLSDETDLDINTIMRQ